MVSAQTAIGVPQHHAWRGTQRTFYTPGNLHDIRDALDGLIGQLDAFIPLAAEVQESFALPALASPADVAAGVTRQVWGHLGKLERSRSPRVRVLWSATAQGEPLMLVTNQSPEQLPAELVSLTYRHRWQVELFFRWLKCILRCRHFLAESPPRLRKNPEAVLRD